MLKIAVAFLLCSVAVCALPGGFNEVDVDDEWVVEAAKHATNELNKQDGENEYHIRLHRVIEANQQVVAGMNYDIEIALGITVCKKAEVDYEDVESCDFQHDLDEFRMCRIHVFRDLKGNHQLTSADCTVN